MIYLATPYSSNEQEVVEERYEIAVDITQFFINEGNIIFSPIVACHPMAMKHNLPGTYEYWKQYNEAFIRASCEVWFALLPGYTFSVGVKGEYELARAHNKSTRIIVPDFKAGNWGQGKYTVSDVLMNNFLESPK